VLLQHEEGLRSKVLVVHKLFIYILISPVNKKYNCMITHDDFSL